MVKRTMTAREELEDELLGRSVGDTLYLGEVKLALSYYYITRKKPLKHKETPAERARRTTRPLFDDGDPFREFSDDDQV